VIIHLTLQNEFTYKVGGGKSINTIVDFNNPPKVFNIYNVKFADIKDFDDRIIDTEFSKYEYENESDITKRMKVRCILKI
jgi:hypothetical protein